jgi:hypothetical protein
MNVTDARSADKSGETPATDVGVAAGESNGGNCGAHAVSVIAAVRTAPINSNVRPIRTFAPLGAINPNGRFPASSVLPFDQITDPAAGRTGRDRISGGAV